MTKETDKISVIVPVYNVKNYLEDCVQSITHQTYPDLEILLIDDGSDDGSGEICDRLQMTDARIRVFHEKHKGVSCTPGSWKCMSFPNHVKNNVNAMIAHTTMIQNAPLTP